MNIILSKFLEMPSGTSFSTQEQLLNITLSDWQRNGLNILSVKPHVVYNDDGTLSQGFIIEYREAL